MFVGQYNAESDIRKLGGVAFDSYRITESGPAVLSRAGPASATHDVDVRSAFLNLRDPWIRSAGQFGQVTIRADFVHVAVHVVNAPGIGLVRSDRRRTFACAVVAARVGVVEVGVLPEQFGIGKICEPGQFLGGVAKRVTPAGTCSTGEFPFGFRRQAIGPTAGQPSGLGFGFVQVRDVTSAGNIDGAVSVSVLVSKKSAGKRFEVIRLFIFRH